MKCYLLPIIINVSSLFCTPALADNVDYLSFFQELSRDNYLPHEARPMGVPLSYDWSSKPVLKYGNQQYSNKALTGWGHVFWSSGDSSGADPNISIQLSDMRVYICSGGDHQWRLVQSGLVYGRQYSSDFKGNVNRLPLEYIETNGYIQVKISKGSAFHFWPKGRRVNIENEELCGTLIMMKARLLCGINSNCDGALIIGFGADYWKSFDSTWGGDKISNVGVGIGRLKRLTQSWQLYGYSTASESDNINFYNNIFDLRK